MKKQKMLYVKNCPNKQNHNDPYCNYCGFIPKMYLVDKKNITYMKTYTCPSCNEEQTTAYQWQTASIPYLLNLEDRKFEPFDSTEMIIGEHEHWTCPNCREPLPEKITEKLFELII